MKKTSLIIADDHTLIRLGLKNIIVKNPNLILLQEFSEGDGAYQYIMEHTPDLAILDIEMPGLNGLEICKRIRKNFVTTKVLFLTMFNQESIFNRAYQVGANGFVLKDFALEELNVAIRKVISGEFYISEQLKTGLSKETGFFLGDEGFKGLLSKLTSTEKKILELIARNYNTKQIAEKLFASELTIKTHRKNIVKKLNLDGNQNALTKFAIRNIDHIS
ncbi:MAG: response regulator transcription factor [Sediminibacterium sp.]|nr:response regulator transcription factor [Sediminibacterium sp.]